MSEIDKYEGYKTKLQGLCDEHNLTYRFRNSEYPITLTIRPVQGLGVQLSMLESADDSNYCSPDASLQFALIDGEIAYKTTQRFAISDALFSKLKNIFKNMSTCYLQYFYRDIITRNLLSGNRPVIDEDEADDELDNEGTSTAEDESMPLSEKGELDKLVAEATLIVRSENKATISLIQRRMNIGYALGAQLMDALEAKGIVGPISENGQREVLPYDEPEDDLSEYTIEEAAFTDVCSN